MKFIPNFAITFTAASALLMPLSALSSETLQNHNFEEDVNAVDFPDFWAISPTSVARLSRTEAASGTRALEVVSGYAAAAQNLNITELAGRSIALRLKVKSPTGTTFGVRVGYYYQSPTGVKWYDHPLIWKRATTDEYQTFIFNGRTRTDAVDGRFWFCLYYNTGTGPLYFDDIELDLVDPNALLTTRQSIEARREIAYAKSYISAGKALDSANTAWPAVDAALAALEAARMTSDYETLMAASQNLKAQVLTALYGHLPFTLRTVEAFERLDPEKLPLHQVATARSLEATVLKSEYGAFGIEISNPSLTAKTVTLQPSVSDDLSNAFVFRRQVLMDTWYAKGATLIADPLTILAKTGSVSSLELEPGETVRLFVEWKAPETAGSYTGNILVGSGATSETIPYSVSVGASSIASTPMMNHYQFLIQSKGAFNALPGLAAADLEAHGVTDIEWAYMPTATTFNANGEVITHPIWVGHTNWLNGFKDTNIRLNIFWTPAIGSMRIQGGIPFVRGSTEEKMAFSSLINAYVTYAGTLGMTPDRFTLLLRDEINSSDYSSSPDASITEYNAFADFVVNETGLENYITLGNYSFPNDAAAIVDRLDTVLAHWPLPTSLASKAPPTYNPRASYQALTLPMLQLHNETRGLRLWTYHVFAGKSSSLLKDSLAYPFLAAAAGYTGFGAWAYNVSAGLTWDDTDGGILDYILVYDGRETHPKNLKYNVSGEKFVPSILWKGLRQSQQDARVYLAVKAATEHPDAPQSLVDEFDTITSTYIALIAGPDGHGSEFLSTETYRQATGAIRTLYAQILSGSPELLEASSPEEP